MASQVDKPRSAEIPRVHTESHPNGRGPPLFSQLLRALRILRGSLRAKFIIVIVALQIALMSAVTVVMDRNQRRAIMEQARLRALSLGGSLATLSEGYLLGYNFAKLEQVAERLTAQDPDVFYTVAHLHDGIVAAYSGRDDLQGTTLDDPVSQRALQATTPLVQEIIIPEIAEPGYDVAIPVIVPGSARKWGTIRLGFSLKRAYRLIHQTRRDLLFLSLGAVVCGTSLAIFLAMRISRPVRYLVAAAQELARGSYDRPVRVDVKDELGYLARAFEQMRASLLRHLESEADERRSLEEANRQLREAQQQLIQSERLAAVGRVSARVAHEVNNPLAIIKTAVHIIRNQSMPGSPTTGSLQMIEDEISRITRIIQELLEFSRPKTPVQEWVQVNAVIQSLKPLLEHDCREKKIALKTILEPELPLVLISSDQLKQVVLNLVRNANDAMPHGGELVIRTAQQGQSVVLSVADTGSGIPAEHREHIFDPFFTTKRRGRGVGLGLSVSYGIITAASGRIEVESKVGKGSTFLVSLPVAQEAERRTNDASTALDSAH
jgi:signal transduction histidine kinase